MDSTQPNVAAKGQIETIQDGFDLKEAACIIVQSTYQIQAGIQHVK